MRSNDFYFNNQFSKQENKEFRTENNKSKLLKITLKQIEDLEKFLNSENFNFEVFKTKINDIDFGLWDFYFIKWFFNSQKELLENQSNKKCEDRIIKNLLSNNNKNMITKIKREVDNLEVWKVID